MALWGGSCGDVLSHNAVSAVIASIATRGRGRGHRQGHVDEEEDEEEVGGSALGVGDDLAAQQGSHAGFIV